MFCDQQPKRRRVRNQRFLLFASFISYHSTLTPSRIFSGNLADFEGLTIHHCLLLSNPDALTPIEKTFVKEIREAFHI
jgi:hypothetical protein